MHSRTVTDAESGEVICIIRGTVVSDKAIEIGPEWRSFTNGEAKFKQGRNAHSL